MQPKHGITTAIALAVAATPLAAAGAAGDRIDITTWNQADLYDGWTAQQLFDSDVRGIENDEIGEIENLVINADGKITKVIVEAGGFLDIGDTHFAVPWDQVEFGPGLDWIEIPVDEDNVDEFSLFEGDEEVITGPRAWRASELINDYVALEDRRGYGIVQDLVFNPDGEVQAVVVYPDVGYGIGHPFAYPYYGYDRGFDPGAETYDLPYTMSEVNELGPFDYNLFRGGPIGAEVVPSEDEQG